MAIGIVLLALLVQWPLHDRAFIPMDEGHLAAAADWMLDGTPLYRGIHTGIFPGIYFITTALFALFGRDVLVMRLATVVMNCAVALCLWCIARRILRPRWAWLPPALHMALIVVAFPVLSMFLYSTLAESFGLFALLFLLRYFEGGRRADAILLGLFIACATLTKQNFGALCFTALLASFFLLRRGSALGERSALRALMPVALSGIFLTLLVVIQIAFTGTLWDLVDSTILGVGGSQLVDFNNPIPPIFGPHTLDDTRFLFLYSPPALFNYLVKGESLLGIGVTPAIASLAIRACYGSVLFILVAAPLLIVRRGLQGRKQETGEERAAAESHEEASAERSTRACVIYGLVFFPGIFPSAIWSHLAFVTIPLLPLAGLVADRIEGELQGPAPAAAKLWRGGVLAGLSIAAVFCAAIPFDVVRWNAVPLDLDRASMKVSERQAGLYQGAHRFIETCAEPGEAIFALPDIPSVYFLSDRPAPTHYDLMIPGNVNGPLIAARLEETGTRCVVYNPQMYPEFPPFVQLFPNLARYVSTHYERTETFGGDGAQWWGLVRRERGARSEP